MATALPLFDRPGEDLEPLSLTVGQLTDLLGAVIEEGFGSVEVAGEVSNLARPRSGHVYFSLKDDRASLRAVLWKRTASRLPFDLADGQAVRARGGLTVYAPRGEYQLVVERIEPEGTGALELAFRQRVVRLEAEGLFDPARKRPLPAYPSRIVVVTSPTGAAVRDFLHVVGRRWPTAEILIAPSRVQGDGAAEEIVAAIDLANRVAEAELVAIVRGGGSLEDLWAFNEEAVARAVAGSRLPVVTGIGHEVDLTLADLAADWRGLTPSEAAERCVPDADAVADRLDALGDRLGLALRARLDGARGRLDALAPRLAGAARGRIAAACARREALAVRLESAARRDLDRRGEHVARLAAQLAALSPLAVLGRGYSLTLGPDGAVARSSASLRPGDLLTTRLAAGSVASRVESTSD